MKLPKLISLLIVCVNFVSSVPSLPFEHGIKLNSASKNEHALQKGSQILNQASDKGEKSTREESGFAKDEDKKYAKSEAEGQYNNQDHVKKIDEESGNYGNENFHKVQGGNLAGIEKKTGHKKGHHKSGFHNTYHKDESGGKSSFYDDANDEADERYINNREGYYGDAGHRANQGGHLNDNRYLKDSRQHGMYDQGVDRNSQQEDSRKYHQDQYHDDRNQHALNNLGGRYDERALSAIEQQKKYHPGHGYGYVPYPVYPEATAPYEVYPPVPVVQPQYRTSYGPSAVKPIYEPSRERKITIYEDPRYVDSGYDKKRDYDDRIDYRPARNNYRYPVYRYY